MLDEMTTEAVHSEVDSYLAGMNDEGVDWKAVFAVVGVVATVGWAVRKIQRSAIRNHEFRKQLREKA